MVVIVLAIMPLRHVPADEKETDVAAKQKGKVSSMIERLADDSRAVRTQARRELLEMGPAVLPLLPAPEVLPSASVREAVRDVRLNLEKGLARESVKPSYVSATAEMTLDGFLKLVKTQTGNEPDGAAIPAEVMQKLIKLNGDRLTFWEAMDQAASQAGLTYAGNAGSQNLKLVAAGEQRDAAPASVTYDGVFRIAVAKAQLRPIFGDEAHRLLRAEINVLTEPRLRPLFLQFAARDLVALGPNGEKFEPFSPGASYELPLENGRSGVWARGEFRVPAAITPEKVELRGSMKMQTAAGSEAFRFKDLTESQGKARRLGGVTTTLQKVEFQKGENGKSAAEIAIGVAYETGGPAFESHRTWIFHNQTWMEDKSGQRVEPEADYKTLLQADGAIAVEYRFEMLTGESSEYSFVYVAPTLIINVPVRFDIHRIPVSSATLEGTTP